MNSLHLECGIMIIFMKIIVKEFSIEAVLPLNFSLQTDCVIEIELTS